MSSVNYDDDDDDDDPMEIDSSTVLHGGVTTLPNSEPIPKYDWSKYDWSNPPKPKPKLLKQTLDPILVRSSITLSKPLPHYLVNLPKSDFRYYDDDFRILSPYDAILPPRPLYGGSATITPLVITDEYRPFLINLSQIALDYYNDIINQKGRWGPSFEFHDLVKCTVGRNVRSRLNTRAYYITFQAYAKGDTSSYITFQAYAKGGDTSSTSPVIKTFQAQVSVYLDDKDKPPVVNECHIKF